MERISSDYEKGYFKHPSPYSVFLIRQSIENRKELIDAFGVQPDLFDRLRSDGESMYAELRECIQHGHKDRALSIALYLKELSAFAA